MICVEVVVKHCKKNYRGFKGEYIALAYIWRLNSKLRILQTKQGAAFPYIVIFLLKVLDMHLHLHLLRMVYQYIELITHLKI